MGEFAISDGVSVVSTTWNEKENIEKLILAIRLVLQDKPHEIIIVDDCSPDETIHIAKRLADIAVTKQREGQTKGLLYGMKLAKFPAIITIDADLENSPEYIPKLVESLNKFDVVVASRTIIPRIWERIAGKTLGKLLGVNDVFSNYRAYKKEAVGLFNLIAGETFGAEFIVIAKKNDLHIGEIYYQPPPRRRNPRIGGKFKANIRIIWALIKAGLIYVI